ncbi:LacI family DNA-binding transcriptional regulator [Pseudonocardia sichuanensis]|uniref:LacI family transcriptional regulator n=1 Tax=Pseudonocardia kunmingensis TaxID=630975 RepID=A0A543D0N1_9PSEU|nr:LacI family DNA-binding transcriptional regulator [Pseudonocardia kunmingensis]TQM02851.1 LacI family transcriptional regulator [Pseudonocardia kunmingensis]
MPQDDADPTPAGGASARPATIMDVARLAEVSPSTVSRALSNPGRVHHRTRERVEVAAAALSYVPSNQARSLSSGRTRTVAVLVPDITNPFYFDLIRGAQRRLNAAGFTQLLVDTDESSDVEAAALEVMRKSSDGVVLAASRLRDEHLAEVARRQPVVTVNRDVPGVPSVVLDTPTGVTQALGHLHSLGHRRVAYVAGPANSWSSARRWTALETEAARLGIEVRLVGPWSPRLTSGAAAADAVLGERVSACVVFNDLIAIGMLTRLRDRDVRVPAELSVVGCDDVFGSDFCHPPLTTVTAPIEDAGRVAVTMLLSRVEPAPSAPPRMRAVLPTHLTVRASSGPAPNAEK